MAASIRFCVSKGFKSRILYLSKTFSTVSPQITSDEYVESEYLDVPQYPPILSTTWEAKKFQERQAWYESIKNLATAEEKLHEISSTLSPTRAIKLGEKITFQELSLIQHCTATHIIDGLPSLYDDGKVDQMVKDLQDLLLEGILLGNLTKKLRKTETPPQSYVSISAERNNTMNSLSNIIYQLFGQLNQENPQLTTAEIIKEPRCEAYWWHKDYRILLKRMRIRNNPYAFQLKNYPLYQIRVKNPLSPVLSRDDPLCASGEVPKFDYPAKALSKGFIDDKRFVTIPGFWPVNACEFPFLSIASMDRVQGYKWKYHDKDCDDAMKVEAIFQSFGWLTGIAANLGFSPFHELTYPLTTQTIVTNGKEWHFFVYQMNTLAMHPDVFEGTHRNILWCSKPMTLYDSIEDGVFKNINPEALKYLIAFMINRPTEVVDYDLKPYLKEDTRTEEQKAQHRYNIRRLYDNRPIHKKWPLEIPMWQRIYKYNRNANPTPTIKFW